ncbi:hypothetical protein [Mesoflavibacter zeaxanthinifaciens]|jgi:hypothetical protein|uniref:hypothetical protein n=1 Tax=Mesoflavibacter zeaxanthinifaciens TaxID=393060 RepID=UPI003A93FD66
MKRVVAVICLGFLSFSACKNEKQTEKTDIKQEEIEKPMEIDDGRIPLNLNPMQKNHQLSNMRSHLEAVQQITLLLSQEKYDEASTLAYEKLGSTTEMRLMCASFGDKGFETMGIEFHKSADVMSEVFKEKNKDRALQALSNTLNYCVSCHAIYKQ